jgi:hypothetical protein
MLRRQAKQKFCAIKAIPKKTAELLKLFSGLEDMARKPFFRWRGAPNAQEHTYATFYRSA